MALVVHACLVDVSGNRSVGLLSILIVVIKVVGSTIFGAAALWAGGLPFEANGGGEGSRLVGLVAAVPELIASVLIVSRMRPCLQT